MLGSMKQEFSAAQASAFLGTAGEAAAGTDVNRSYSGVVC